MHARQAPRVLQLALVRQLARLVPQRLGPVGRQQLRPQGPAVRLDGCGLDARPERAHRLLLARLAQRCLALQNPLPRAVELLPVLHTHFQQIPLQSPGLGQLLPLQLLRAGHGSAPVRGAHPPRPAPARPARGRARTDYAELQLLLLLLQLRRARLHVHQLRAQPVLTGAVD